MRIVLPTTRRKARIEIIPLIDIVFFLLATFVMVSLSMVKNQGVTVKLPVAHTSTEQQRKDFATISVTEGGVLYLDKEIVDRKTLASRLKKIKATNPEISIFINGDEKAMFGDAVGILDEVRTMGIHKVSIQTRSGKNDG